MIVTGVAPDRRGEVVSVLAESFRDYPVMRYVLGKSADYDVRLDTLVGFFTDARVLRGEPLLGIEDAGGLVAAAMVSYPQGSSPPELAEVREATWHALGPDARARYESFGAAASEFDVDRPHIHLNMIGVRDRGRGQGLGRLLLDHVHRMSAGSPTSEGVTLSTEDPGNVALYEYFGYRVVGHVSVGPGLETWGFFRPDGP